MMIPDKMTMKFLIVYCLLNDEWQEGSYFFFEKKTFDTALGGGVFLVQNS